MLEKTFFEDRRGKVTTKSLLFKVCFYQVLLCLPWWPLLHFPSFCSTAFMRTDGKCSSFKQIIFKLTLHKKEISNPLMFEETRCNVAILTILWFRFLSLPWLRRSSEITGESDNMFKIFLLKGWPHTTFFSGLF